MSYIDIWTRSAIAQQDTQEKRFVDYKGKLGGHTGVSLSVCKTGQMVSILTIGEAEVEIAEGQTIAIGDLVTGNNLGLAIKSTTNTGASVLEVNQTTIRVIVK